MNLGLLDILTAQQAERPDFKGGNNVSERPVPSNNEKEFKDYVKNEIPTKPAEVSDAIPPKNDDINALIALANNNIDASKLPSGFGKDDLINILKALKSQNIDLNQIDFSDENFVDKILAQLQNLGGNKTVTNLNSLVQNSGTNAANTNFGNQILNNLLSLQEAEGLQTQIIPPQDIVKKFGQAISSFSNEVAQAGLQTSESAQTSTNSQLTNSTSIQLEGLATTQLENIDDIELAKIPLGQVPNDLIQAQTNTQSLSGLTNIAEGNIAKLAENVLQTAKVNAEEPQLLQTDVKSGQIESLLNLKSNEKQNNTEISNTSSKDAAILDKIAANNAQNMSETNKQLQNQLDNQKVADNKAAISSVQNNGSQLQNNLSNNDSNGFRNSSEFFAQTFSNNSTEAPATTGEFTKFQKYVDTVSNNIKNMGTEKAAKAQDVLAQIKFGISSINSKASNKITIQLHPKELGSVDVRMDIGNDGKTKVAIMTEKIDTLNLLQKESGSLKGLLQDALQTQSSDLSFSFHEQSDEKWKEIIQEAFGDSNSQNNEEDEDINNMSGSSKYYSNNMMMTDGLDISV